MSWIESDPLTIQSANFYNLSFAYSWPMILDVYIGEYYFHNGKCYSSYLEPTNQNSLLQPINIISYTSSKRCVQTKKYNKNKWPALLLHYTIREISQVDGCANYRRSIYQKEHCDLKPSEGMIKTSQTTILIVSERIKPSLSK